MQENYPEITYTTEITYWPELNATRPIVLSCILHVVIIVILFFLIFYQEIPPQFGTPRQQADADQANQEADVSFADVPTFDGQPAQSKPEQPTSVQTTSVQEPESPQLPEQIAPEPHAGQQAAQIPSSDRPLSQSDEPRPSGLDEPRRRKIPGTDYRPYAVNDFSLERMSTDFAAFAAQQQHYGPESTADLVARRIQEFSDYAYQRKASWILKGSFDKSHITMPPALITRQLNKKIVLQLLIQKDGTICNARLMPSTGLHDLDDYIISIVKSTGLLPTLPSHFADQVYKFEIPFIIRVPRGAHHLVLHPA